MEKKQLDKIVSAWIRGHHSEKGSPEYEANFWASERLFDYVDDDPETAWEVIDAIRHATDDSKLHALLAAGHLEDLLATHGEKFIERFEALAKTDKNFRKLLAGVWQNFMSDVIWQRVRRIVDMKESKGSE